MAASQKVEVHEKRRQIVFTDGQRLDLHNVTAFDPSGTWLRIWSDEGISILNPDKILYHLIKEPRQDIIAADNPELVRGVTVREIKVPDFASGNQIDKPYESIYGSDGNMKD